jgi:uncharacterized protein with HEPN domain
MSLQQIGTLSGVLSDSFKDSSKERMPWGIMRNMRNRFAHTYELMDKNIIWETATQDIPNLLLFCEEVIENHLSQLKFIERPSDKEEVIENPSNSPRLKP